jgi:hypothetical protein
MVPDVMDIDTEVGKSAVSVYVDGTLAGTLDREWWQDWSSRIDNEPEECLASCLSSADDDLGRALES